MPGGKIWRCWRFRRSLLAGPLSLFLAVATLAAGPADARAASVQAPLKFTVSSTTGWQKTPLTLQPGQAYTVSFVSGAWTVDYRNFPKVGPGGYSNSVDQTIYQGCKYDPHSNYAVLLGAVGDSATAFRVGRGGVFKAPSSGSLYLRINDDNACLTDNAGTVTMYLAPVGQVRNFSYAGYSVQAGGNGAFGLVEADWVVPAISSIQCALNGALHPRAAAWAGLWGTPASLANGTGWLPQIGTISVCNKAGHPGPNYEAFWEMFTSVSGGGAKGFGAGAQLINSMTVMPGDTMSGSVEYEGMSGTDLKFRLELFDVTRGTPGSPDSFSITVTTTKPVKFGDIMSQGGAVVEPNCSDGLAKFTSVPFTDVQAVSWNGTPRPAGMSLNKWIMIGSNNATLADPGSLSGFPGLMSYTVNWKANGPTGC